MNSHGDGPFLRPPERVPEVPVKYPKIHVSTGEESSGSGPDSTQGLRPRHRRERNPERPPRNSHGDWPFLRPPERVPEVPVLIREHLPHLEKIQEVLPSRRARDEGSFRCEFGKEFWEFLSHLKRRRGLTRLRRLQKYPKIRVNTGEESSGSGPDSTQGLRIRDPTVRKPQRPASNTHGDWPFLRPQERVPEVPDVIRQHLLQLEKIQEVLPCRRDEAHFR
ncbi:hypothetical protein R6Z07F_005573 [Ovis aries]